MSDLNISVAKMEVQVQNLEKDMTEMKADVKAIRATLDKAAGGWKTLMIVGGLSATIGSIVTKVMLAWPFGR